MEEQRLRQEEAVRNPADDAAAADKPVPVKPGQHFSIEKNYIYLRTKNTLNIKLRPHKVLS